MFFATQPVSEPLRPPAAALVGDVQHCAPVDSAAGARDVTAAVPVDRPTSTLAYEDSMSSAR
jgi:hypothetical protein